MATAIQLPPAPVTSNDPSQAHAEQEETQTGEVSILQIIFVEPCLEDFQAHCFSFSHRSFI